jgi:hypothetical protein
MKKTMAHVACLKPVRWSVTAGGLISMLVLMPGAAHAGKSSFTTNLPPLTKTVTLGPYYADGKQPPPTDQIRVRLTRNNSRDITIRAIKCEGGALAPEARIPANNREAQPVAGGVHKGQCFQLKFSVVGHNGLRNVSGRVSF